MRLADPALFSSLIFCRHFAFPANGISTLEQVPERGQRWHSHACGLCWWPQVTDATHAALLRPVWRPIGPLVMALADMRDEMPTGLRRFRDLFRRNELKPDTQRTANISLTEWGHRSACASPLGGRSTTKAATSQI
jgi:hypothetical protein